MPLVAARRAAGAAAATALLRAALVLTQVWFPSATSTTRSSSAGGVVLARDLVLVALLAVLAWPERPALLSIFFFFFFFFFFLKKKFMARTPLANAVEEAVAKIADESAVRRGGSCWRAPARRSRAPRCSAPSGGPLRAGSRARRGSSLSGPASPVLSAAYRLQQAGIRGAVFEGWPGSAGAAGRVAATFADGQIYEHGGELIDSNHIEMKQLAQELGLSLDNLRQAETKAPSSSATSSASRTRSGR